MIDLHTHSDASDGDYHPALLIQEAKKFGLSAIALTDHDTLGGLERAQAEAKTAGIKFIPGIEVNILWTGQAGISGLGPGAEFHLLGLGLSSPSAAFLDSIAELSRRRETRNLEILERMHELSIDANWEEIKSFSGGYSIGRPHFANFLVSKKIVKNCEQAFDRYLKPGKPLYVPKAGLNFDQTAALIRESGGIPVLAHPMSLFISWGRLPDLIKTLKERRLMGIEAWHPTAKAKSCRRLEELGKKLGLYVTEGSDFHGPKRPGRNMGFSSFGRKIDASVLEAIPELCGN